MIDYICLNIITIYRGEVFSMENTQIIYSIINHIKEYISSQNISQEKVREKCSSKGYKIAQGSISNMFQKPTSTTLSTLLKVCDGLDLNLLDIFNHVYRFQNNESNQGKFIYDINDDAYNGYKNTFHIYFLPTINNNGMLQHHGTLYLNDLQNMGECDARLELDTGEKNNNGAPFIKVYTGQLVVSKLGCAYINLISDQYGDMWFLIINHGYLNQKPLICTLANAVTASSGRVRYPTLHRAILSREELDDNVLSYIRGFLRLSSDEILISSEQFHTFLEKTTLSEEAREKLISLQKNSNSFFSFSKNVLESSLPRSEYVYIISMLITYSTAPINNKVTDKEDDYVFQIINEYIKQKTDRNTL